MRVMPWRRKVSPVMMVMLAGTSAKDWRRRVGVITTG